MIHRAKKSLGQNFLKSKEAIREIVTAAALSENDTVLEVGPGKGVLTEALLESGGEVIAIEKDDSLIEPLRQKFASEIETGKLTLIHGDILEIDTRAAGLEEGQYKLVANIPYYITGVLLRRFLSEIAAPERMVVMLQKEVADRIVARDHKESLLSISVKVYGTPKKIMNVPAKYFSPEPDVDSAVLLVSAISKQFFEEIDEEDFFTLVKTGFAHKRKQLAGNLTALYEKETVAHAMREAGLNEKVRAEDISLEDWKKLYLYFQTN